MVPPWSSTSRLTSVRPIPSPSRDRSSDVSAWTNRSNSVSRCSGAIPMPLSRTLVTASSPSRKTDSWIEPPLSVNLAALLSKLPITCDRRPASASTYSGSAGIEVVSVCSSLSATAESSPSPFRRPGRAQFARGAAQSCRGKCGSHREDRSRGATFAGSDAPGCRRRSPRSFRLPAFAAGWPRRRGSAALADSEVREPSHHRIAISCGPIVIDSLRLTHGALDPPWAETSRAVLPPVESRSTAPRRQSSSR